MGSPLIATVMCKSLMSVLLGYTAMLSSSSPCQRSKEATLTMTLRLLFVDEIKLFILGGYNERLLHKFWR